MPVRIVSTSSNPHEGEINQNDLFRISEDFENFVGLESHFQRPVNKTNFVAVPRHILKALVDNTDIDGEYVKIHFGLTLPNQKSCADDFQTDISNQLTIIVNIAKEVGNVLVDQTNIGDLIITAGFRSNTIRPIIPVCCGKPGGGS